MCGIHVVVSGSPPEQIPTDLERRLRNRGPDHSATHTTSVKTDDAEIGNIHIVFTSTVLALRGDHIARQPLIDEQTGSVLCWNGEAWRIRHADVSGNDGEAIASLLYAACQCAPTAREDAIMKVFRSIDGPFAFVFFDGLSKRLYFGRDRLGRRSLLIRSDSDGLVLSSIAESKDPAWQEVEADGAYALDLTPCIGSVHNELNLPPFTKLEWLEGDGAAEVISSIGTFNTSIPSRVELLPEKSTSVQALRQQLTESLKLRVLNVPDPPCPNNEQPQTKVAILFSGGLDCAVLARLCHEILPRDHSVDLLNVAFENPRVAANAAKSKDRMALENFDIYEACPDRVTGRKSFAELLTVCPGRAWRFIAVNVPYSEYLYHRSEVTSLIYPHNTEMDLSIACALYFAARGKGTAFADASSASAPHTTSARVLLSGLGADELFGGYSRHVAAFERLGYASLIDELKLDVGRLGKRNLGRDDRAISNWGREVRFPFLDEDFMRWAMQLRVEDKCDFGHPEGLVEPAKRILRLLALELGMNEVAMEKKRAIQFGSRTAKMESGKVKGTTLLS